MEIRQLETRLVDAETKYSSIVERIEKLNDMHKALLDYHSALAQDTDEGLLVLSKVLAITHSDSIVSEYSEQLKVNLDGNDLSQLQNDLEDCLATVESEIEEKEAQKLSLDSAIGILRADIQDYYAS